MAMNATIAVRTDENVKRQAQEVFADLGMDISTAINVFLRQTIIYQGFPFMIRKEVPNEATMKALEDAENGENVLGPYTSFKELMAEDLDEEA